MDGREPLPVPILDVFIRGAMYQRIRFTRNRRGPYLASLVLFVWWVAFLVVSPVFVDDSLADYEASLRNTAASVEAGSLPRQLLIVGLLAAALIVMGGRLTSLRDFVVSPAGALLTFFVIWNLLSTAWSVDTSLTIRRSSAMALMVAALVIWGFVFYGKVDDGLRLLSLHAVVVGAITMVYLWGAAVLNGEILLTDPAWTLVPRNVAAPPSAVIGVGLIAGVARRFAQRQPKRNPLPWVGGRVQPVDIFLALSLITLISLKKRMSIAVVLLVLVFYLLRRLTGRSRVAVVILALVAASIGSVLLFNDEAAAQSAQTYVVLGDESTDRLLTLTGRLPLWEALIDDVAASPLGGYGYGAYWTPSALLDVLDRIDWPAVNAHNGYLEQALGTGLAGLVLLVALFAVGARSAVRLARRRVEEGAMVGAWLAIYLLLNITESAFIPLEPLFFFAIGGIAAVVGREVGSSRDFAVNPMPAESR